MSGNEEDAKSFLKAKLEYHGQKKCYFLFRKAHQSLLDVTNQEQHKAWWLRTYPEGGPYHECYSLEDLHDVIAYIEEMKGLLRSALSIQTAEEFEHNGHLFKLIPVHDAEVIKKLLKNAHLADYVDGFFSEDTDITGLRDRILKSKGCIAPEELLYLGEWAVVRRRDLFDGWPCVLYTNNPEDFAAYIAREKKEYQDRGVNTKPIIHE